jgi:hypothetical protein
MLLATMTIGRHSPATANHHRHHEEVLRQQHANGTKPQRATRIASMDLQPRFATLASSVRPELATPAKVLIPHREEKTQPSRRSP